MSVQYKCRFGILLKIAYPSTVLHFHYVTMYTYLLGVYTKYGKKEVQGMYVYNQKGELKGEVTIKVTIYFECILIQDIYEKGSRGWIKK